MSEFLSKILETKHLEVADMKRNGGFLEKQVRSEAAKFATSIRDGSLLSIVAEVKKASPSKGLIQPNFNPVETAHMYESFGASAVSILTDRAYFQGSIKDLASVHQRVNVPVLRKDFIIDEVQINEAVAAGADAVLLICAALSQERLQELSQYAKDCGLDVLVEVHQDSELEAAISASPSVLGINNRDLRTFHVDLAVTEYLMGQVPASIPVLSESGISAAEDARRMAAAGVDGLLCGESLMRQATSGANLKELFKSLQEPKQGRALQRRSSSEIYGANT